MALLVSVACLGAQDVLESEDLLELSPFSISTDSENAYKSTSSLAGTRMNSQVLDPNSGQYCNVAVSVLKRADAVAVQFVLSHAGEKQELRNNELNASIEAIEAALKGKAGLRMEQREVRFAGGNKKIFSSVRGGSPFSFASLVIFADLPAGVRVVERVKQIRDLLTAAKLVGATKAADGAVGLYVRNPDQYRREILQKIFEDLDFVRKGVGPEFEVMPNGLGQKVKYRVAGEGEVELWIDYSFSFTSIRGLQKPTTK